MGWQSIDYAQAHIAEYKDLERKLGPIVEDIVGIFYSLSHTNLNTVLLEYGDKYGLKAENYARTTFEKWKTGERKMSGQTASRLIEGIPPFLTTSQRYNLLKKLSDHCITAKRVNHSINIEDPQPDIRELQSLMEQASRHRTETHLPDNILATVSWLNSDDMVAARQILARIDKEINDHTTTIADKEIRNIANIVSKSESYTASKTIPLTGTSIEVKFYRPEKSLPWVWIIAGVSISLFIYNISQQ